MTDRAPVGFGGVEEWANVQRGGRMQDKIKHRGQMLTFAHKSIASSRCLLAVCVCFFLLINSVPFARHQTHIIPSGDVFLPDGWPMSPSLLSPRVPARLNNGNRFLRPSFQLFFVRGRVFFSVVRFVACMRCMCGGGASCFFKFVFSSLPSGFGCVREL